MMILTMLQRNQELFPESGSQPQIGNVDYGMRKASGSIFKGTLSLNKTYSFKTLICEYFFLIHNKEHHAGVGGFSAGPLT